MLKNRRPRLNNLQVFGSIAYAKVLGPLKKLDNRSKKLQFVGYAPSGYRLWDEERRNIIVARDVKFKTEVKKDEIKCFKKISLNQLNEDEEDSEEEKEEKNLVHQYEEKEDTSDQEEVNEDFFSQDDQETEKENIETKGINNKEIRKSTRNKRIPLRFEDYAYLTYNEAIKGTDKEKWKII